MATKKKQIVDKLPIVIKSAVIAEEAYVPTPEQHKTLPYMSRYEYAALITARAAQLSGPNGRPLLPAAEITNYDPLYIATKEVNLRLPNLVIRRTLPNGTTEDWLLTDEKNPMHFPRL